MSLVAGAQNSVDDDIANLPSFSDEELGCGVKQEFAPPQPQLSTEHSTPQAEAVTPQAEGREVATAVKLEAVKIEELAIDAATTPGQVQLKPPVPSAIEAALDKADELLAEGAR